MSAAVEVHKKEEEKKEVSWGKQWAWKEGEEEKTQSKRLAWKNKRKRLKAGIVNRSAEEAAEYIDKQVEWMYHVLKDERCAKYIIYAATQKKNALFSLRCVLANLGIGFADLAMGLKQFRDDNNITMDSIMGDEDKKDAVYALWRVKNVRENFVQPELLSSTDTDEDRRGRAAARAIEDPGVVESFAGLPRELQRVMANYTTRVHLNSKEDSDAAAASLSHEWGVGSKEESDATTILPTSSHEAPERNQERKEDQQDNLGVGEGDDTEAKREAKLQKSELTMK